MRENGAHLLEVGNALGGGQGDPDAVECCAGVVLAGGLLGWHSHGF